MRRTGTRLGDAVAQPIGALLLVAPELLVSRCCTRYADLLVRVLLLVGLLLVLGRTGC